MKKILALGVVFALAGCASLWQSPPPPNDPVTLRVNVFRGSSNLPIYMAQEKGYFARRGVTLQMQFTPNSVEQRAGLAAGRFEIAHAAVDNAVAMIEGAKADAVIVAGGDGGMNELLVRQDIHKVSDLRGRTYVVDAPNTAYALIGRKVLKDAGLKEGQDYKIHALGGSEARTKGLDTPEGAATLLNPPWNFLARERGAKSLGRTVDLRDSATPVAMTQLLTGLFQGKWLSQQSRAVLLGTMERCLTGRHRMRALLPGDARIAHKTGTLNNTASDVGIIQAPDGHAYAVAIYVTGQGGKPNRDSRIAMISRAVYDGYLTESSSLRRTASR